MPTPRDFSRFSRRGRLSQYFSVSVTGRSRLRIDRAYGLRRLAKHWADFSLCQQLRHHPLAGQRQIAQPRAERMQNRVADGGDRRSGGGFADAERWMIRQRIDQSDRHFRHFGKP